MVDVDPQGMCIWLRAQGQRLINMADEIEAIFGGLATKKDRMVATKNPAKSDNTRTTPPSVGELKQLMGDKAMRRVVMVEKLGLTDIALLDDVLTADNGFHEGSKGWWSVRNQPHGDNDN